MSVLIITPTALGDRKRVVLNVAMFKTKCLRQTPSLNFTSWTCGENCINWYKPRRVLNLQALHLDEVEEKRKHLEQAKRVLCENWSGFKKKTALSNISSTILLREADLRGVLLLQCSENIFALFTDVFLISTCFFVGFHYFCLWGIDFIQRIIGFSGLSSPFRVMLEHLNQI